MNEKYSKSLYIMFPAIAMLLGWGLRGHIGGGPYGAMIPGAMVALSLCLLLELSATTTSMIVVFSVVGIGLGGEMTYGQTLGFLRNPETVMWGTLATTVKGAIWGILGGAVLSLGLVYHKISKKTIITALLLMILGVFIGFKLINDPMLLYFSDPVKPRAESWAALLFGAILLLAYLKIKIPVSEFKVVFRFAILGMVGGGLGFGLGGLWMVLGSHLPDVIFKSWWKAMEFTFGLLLGASLGYATWLSRNESTLQILKEEKSSQTENYPVWKELGVVLVTGLLVFWLIPYVMELLAETTIVNNMPGGTFRDEIARMMVNYSVTGLLFVLVLMRFPKVAWQLGITLTFCHTLIDFADDYLTTILAIANVILIPTLIVALLVVYYRQKKNAIRSLFLLLTWSTVLVSMVKIGFSPEKLNLAGQSFCTIICGIYIVDIVFAVSAVFLTWIVIRKFQYE